MALSNDPGDGLAEHVVSTRDTFMGRMKNETVYLGILATLFIVAAVVYDQPRIAMWFGFMLAGYSAIANDSIQTIGTFIASNHHRKWWVLWLFIGAVFVLTILDSLFIWEGGGFVWTGDVSHDRLASKGFAQAPETFKYLQLAAPIFLLILTRLRVPVSTSFLILTCFATDPEGITSMLIKSLSGYGVAFAVAILVWGATTRLMEGLMARASKPASVLGAAAVGVDRLPVVAVDRPGCGQHRRLPAARDERRAGGVLHPIHLRRAGRAVLPARRPDPRDRHREELTSSTCGPPR